MRPLLLLTLAACTTPHNYGQQAATAACERAERCDTTAFDAQFADVDQCADDLELFFGGDCYVTWCDTFVLDAATACIQEVRAAPCPGEATTDDDDATGVCDEVWSGCAPEILDCLANGGVDVGL